MGWRENHPNFERKKMSKKEKEKEVQETEVSEECCVARKRRLYEEGLSKKVE